VSKRWPFTRAAVDHLVSEAKIIKFLPPIKIEGDYFMMRATVYMKSEPSAYVHGGLIVSSRLIRPVPGIPRQIPSCALEWHGYRIRGIDREILHDNPDGSSVRGWHEHLWSPESADALVISTREPRQRDLRGLFKAGLKRWNIDVLHEQLEVE
jgi:hypothetical protein